jgi:hypothetical protein
MATANVALVLVLGLGLAFLLGGGSALPRLMRAWSASRAEQELRRERLKQAKLETEILEEKLRNEILRDVSARDEEHGR